MLDGGGACCTPDVSVDPITGDLYSNILVGTNLGKLTVGGSIITGSTPYSWTRNAAARLISGW